MLFKLSLFSIIRGSQPFSATPTDWPLLVFNLIDNLSLNVLLIINSSLTVNPLFQKTVPNDANNGNLSWLIGKIFQSPVPAFSISSSSK